MAAIEVRDLKKTYRPGEVAPVPALDGVTLTIQAGEFVSVVGRSGSGKTTLLHGIGLLLRPTAGEVVIDGIETAALTDGQRADLRGHRVGFVLRDPCLLPTLDALENVMLPLRYARMGGGAGKRARDLLETVGLGDRMGHRPDQLSVGQAQRVAIARAMLKTPTVVLADEPTGDVDSETSDELLYLMQQLNRMTGVSFVVATVDADVAHCMDRVIRLRDGQVVADQRLRLDTRLGRAR